MTDFEKEVLPEEIHHIVQVAWLGGYFAEVSGSWTDTRNRSRELLGALYPYVHLSLLSGWRHRDYALMYDGPRGHCVADVRTMPGEYSGAPVHPNCRCTP